MIRLSRTKVTAAVASAIAISVIMWMGVAPSFAQERHVIKVNPVAGVGAWSATAELYSGAGVLVYDWSERHNGGDFVRWEFTDGGDGGFLNVSIFLGGIQVEGSYGIPLNSNYCFTLQDDDFTRTAVDQVTPCPF